VGYGHYKQLMNDIEHNAPGFFLAGHFRDGVSLGDSIVAGLRAAERVGIFFKSAPRTRRRARRSRFREPSHELARRSAGQPGIARVPRGSRRAPLFAGVSHGPAGDGRRVSAALAHCARHDPAPAPPESAQAYAKIWTPEGSPLIAISRKVRDELARRVGMPVELAMRYSSLP